MSSDLLIALLLLASLLLFVALERSIRPFARAVRDVMIMLFWFIMSIVLIMVLAYFGVNMLNQIIATLKS